MALAPSQVTSRSDSDAFAIRTILDNLDLSPEARMAAVAQYAADWDAATDGSTGRLSAEREVREYRARGSVFRGATR